MTTSHWGRIVRGRRGGGQSLQFVVIFGSSSVQETGKVDVVESNTTETKEEDVSPTESTSKEEEAVSKEPETTSDNKKAVISHKSTPVAIVKSTSVQDLITQAICRESVESNKVVTKKSLAEGIQDWKFHTV